MGRGKVSDKGDESERGGKKSLEKRSDGERGKYE